MAQNGFKETTKSEKKFFAPTAPPNSPKKWLATEIVLSYFLVRNGN
jgi:hypothetical protein